MADLVSVKFLRRFDVYNEGEVAGFPEKRAEALVKAKVAAKTAPKKKAKACRTPSAEKTKE